MQTADERDLLTLSAIKTGERSAASVSEKELNQEKDERESLAPVVTVPLTLSVPQKYHRVLQIPSTSHANIIPHLKV